jgi:acetoin utilization deacetylase AcuC-like enzyme
MITIYDDTHRYHDPPHNFEDGRLVESAERPLRAAVLLQALQSSGLGPVLPRRSFGAEALAAVHSPTYLAYLEHAYENWVQAGGDPAAALPSTFAVRWMDNYQPHPLSDPGYYAFDTSAPIVAGTYTAARAAIEVALTGAACLRELDRAALPGAPQASPLGVYALCRPPGHHAGSDLMGGYCYLNNAAIAAQHLVQSGGRVAILDIDLHHGNGTQQIFYHRQEVFFVSIHIDPAAHYPHFSGFAHETGAGPGQGYNLNLPLPAGTGNAAYLAALQHALAALRQFAPAWLVVSLGFDTYKEDPVGGFALDGDIFAQIGRRVAGLGLPTLFVQEGGYHLPTLGTHLLDCLGAFQQGALA